MYRPFLLVCAIAFWLLTSCVDGGSLKRAQLAALEQDNRNDSLMRNDSLAEQLVAYFDAHGSRNERMRASYILGRTYFDLGELPRALETYYQAADCADTTAPDCDFKTLSRVHAQAAEVFRAQVQLGSELDELRKAIHFAELASDTAMALECLVNQSGVYVISHKYDSVIITTEAASTGFLKYGDTVRAAQIASGAITSHLSRGELTEAKKCIDLYELRSGFFDHEGRIVSGREIYYYAKGNYYLAVNKLDSAEMLFRRLFYDGSTLNRQIAGSRGLRDVFEKRGISDSIARYANLSYELNDSAYSLSEMENIQKMQASYNYNHNKQIAEKSQRDAEVAYLILIIVGIFILVCLLISFFLFSRYKDKKNQKILKYQQNLNLLENLQTEIMQLRSAGQETEQLLKDKTDQLVELQKKISELQAVQVTAGMGIEDVLNDSEISIRFREMLNSNPPKVASNKDFKELRQYINEVIPSFYSTLNSSANSLRPIEYDVCLLIRFHFQPAEISKLTGQKDAYISNLRRRILLKVFGVNGTPKDLDKRILQIR